MELPKTISELQEGLIKKEFSAVELIDKYLARIKAFDKDLNSFITVTDERAYDDARKIDEYLRNKANQASPLQDKPLLGAVVAYKDMFLTKGVRTTAGSRVLESYVPAYSATVVERLERAGVIMIGKTNQDAWAHGASGENSDFGVTHNPWDKTRVAGGSSSGSAAAVSANLATFATGTDTGGSIRQPASFTNTVGFKPTYGAVSRYGIVAMASSLDSIGHITRSVSDTKRIFEITRGEDGHDSTLKKQKTNIKFQKGKIKVGIPREYFGEGLDSEVGEIIKNVIEVYKKLGVEFKEVSLAHTKYGISVYYIVMPAEVSSNLSRYDGVRYGNDRTSFSDEAKRRIMLGTYTLSAGYYDAYYLKAMKVRSKIIEDFDKVFADVDVLITPVSPTAAFKIGEKASDPLRMYLSDIFTVSANLAGIPGLSIPAGFTKAGLPVGFQLMGPRFSENKLFTLGETYQKETDFHKQMPNL
jgi:aspartyl-tRNA(Asn)/glutamyl-tRNA(Gln) amidotransferase subunit A